MCSKMTRSRIYVAPLLKPRETLAAQFRSSICKCCPQKVATGWTAFEEVTQHPILTNYRHLAVEQGQAFKELAVSSRNHFDEISNLVKHAVLKQLEQKDQYLSAMQKEMRINSSQHVKAVQQVVRPHTTLKPTMADRSRASIPYTL